MTKEVFIRASQITNTIDRLERHIKIIQRPGTVISIETVDNRWEMGKDFIDPLCEVLDDKIKALEKEFKNL